MRVYPMDINKRIFGLSKSQILPILSNIVGDKVLSFDININHQVQGYRGYSADKIIPTFTYITESGLTGEVTVFIKKFYDSGPVEVHHYVYLQKYNAPIPRMYGFLTDTEQHEILFLEYLEPIGDVEACRTFTSNIEHFRKLLSVAAKFNAIKPSDEYIEHLSYRNFDNGLKNAVSVLDDLFDHALKGELGNDLKQFCLESQHELSNLQKFTLSLINPINHIEIGLLHGDIYPENTCWNKDKSELIIIDFEHVGLGPRFYDVALWLGSPDHIKKYNDLHQHYLGQYNDLSDKLVTLKDFVNEVFILWFAWNLTGLWFPLGRALDGLNDWTEDREEGRQFFRNELIETLSTILRDKKFSM